MILYFNEALLEIPWNNEIMSKYDTNTGIIYLPCFMSGMFPFLHFYLSLPIRHELMVFARTYSDRVRGRPVQ